ncbi:MAG: DUF58 domain-containing protein [Bellilinea sp.]
MIIRRAFLAYLVLLGGVYLAAYLSEPQNTYVYYRVGYLLILVGLVSLIWTAASLRGLEIHRTSRVLRQQVGQIFEERFEIINLSRLGRLWLEVRDLTDLPGKRGSKVVANIGPHQYRSYYSRTLLTQRGSFLLGPTMISSGDPFGLFAREKLFESDHKLVVLPFMVNLENFPGPTGRLPGGRALRRKSLEVTPYAAGVREYAPGDPLSRIHWRSTARKDRLMVKEFEQDPQADVWVLLDALQGVNLALPHEPYDQLQREQFWVLPHRVEVPLPPDTFEYAVSAAASIANYYILEGRSVGFASSATHLNLIPAERGERQLGKILEVCAFLKPEGKLPLLGLIEGQANQIVRGSTVVLVTASNTENMVLAVDILQRRDLQPVVVLIDPRGFGSATSSDEIAEKIRQYNVPVSLIRRDDSLQAALEFGKLPHGSVLEPPKNGG